MLTMTAHTLTALADLGTQRTGVAHHEGRRPPTATTAGRLRHYILGPSGPDCDLRRWGLSRAPAGRGSARKRTVVAVARRLAVMLHHLWVNGEVYDPLHRATATPAA
jgi:hypothetical protein